MPIPNLSADYFAISVVFPDFLKIIWPPPIAACVLQYKTACESKHQCVMADNADRFAAVLFPFCAREIPRAAR